MSFLKKQLNSYSSCAAKIVIAAFLLLWATVSGFSQMLPVGSAAEADLRARQLMGGFDSAASFTVRPLSGKEVEKTADAAGYSLFSRQRFFAGEKGRFGVLPGTITQQFNTHHPYGWNDGAMIPANGYQALVSAGIYASFGPLEVQLQPEFVFAPNTSFQTTADYGTASPRSYSRFFPGQSTIKISAGAFSLGLSSQNLWWGPGIHSSLLMSNNAPGFIHGFFSSNRPARTGIGSFEWQLIGAKLTSDNSYPYENRNLQTANVQPPNARYLSAVVISYQPKWVPGLFVGLTRALQRYRKDIDLSGTNFLDRYIPVIVKPLQKADAQSDDTMRTDQLASFFLRWVLPRAHAEFYVEYGFNDYNQNTRDYVMSPTHSAAHLVGFKEVVPLRDSAYLDLGAEITEMSQSPDAIVRDAGNWYVHGQVLQGYTHDNQILGTGAGLGCNVQTITGKWVRGVKQWGVILEHVNRDPQNHTFQWNDYSIGFMPQWKYRGILFSGLIQFIQSKNYGWENINRFNIHSRLSIQYFF